MHFRPPFFVSLILASAAAGWAADVDPARLVNIAARVAVGGVAGTPIPGFVLGDQAYAALETLGKP